MVPLNFYGQGCNIMSKVRRLLNCKRYEVFQMFYFFISEVFSIFIYFLIFLLLVILSCPYFKNYKKGAFSLTQLEFFNNFSFCSFVSENSSLLHTPVDRKILEIDSWYISLQKCTKIIPKKPPWVTWTLTFFLIVLMYHHVYWIWSHF